MNSHNDTPMLIQPKLDADEKMLKEHLEQLMGRGVSNLLVLEICEAVRAQQWPNEEDALREMRQLLAELIEMPAYLAPGLPVAVDVVFKHEQGRLVQDFHAWLKGEINYLKGKKLVSVPRWAVEQIEVIGQQCLDAGKCHHGCVDKCFRRTSCGPLSGATWLNPDWTIR